MRHNEEKDVSITEAEITRWTGFELCEFGPEPGMTCEKCKADNVQLYFRGPNDAGEYACRQCAEREAAENMSWDFEEQGEKS